MNINREQVLREVAGQANRIACVEGVEESKLILQDLTPGQRGIELSFLSIRTLGRDSVELRFDDSNQLAKILVEYLDQPQKPL